jgi:uncharacterized membrane protein
MDPSYQLWFAVRYLHVASAAVLAGGALIVAVSCALPRGRGGAAAAHSAPLYEWMFWALIAVAAATGVSNLGLKGDGLLGPATSWGRALSAKLSVVLGVLALSLLRTDFVLRCFSSSDDAAVPARARAILATLYGVTVALLLGALWVGLGLAHGRY